MSQQNNDVPCIPIPISEQQDPSDELHDGMVSNNATTVVSFGSDARVSSSSTFSGFTSLSSTTQSDLEATPKNAYLSPLSELFSTAQARGGKQSSPQLRLVGPQEQCNAKVKLRVPSAVPHSTEPRHEHANIVNTASSTTHEPNSDLHINALSTLADEETITFDNGPLENSASYPEFGTGTTHPTTTTTTQLPRLDAELAVDHEELVARIHQEISSEWQARVSNQREVVDAVAVVVEKDSSQATGSDLESGDLLFGGVHHKRYFWMLSSCLCLVVGAVIGGVLAVAHASGSDVNAADSRKTPPTAMPTMLSSSTGYPTMSPSLESEWRRNYLLQTLGPSILVVNNGGEEELDLFNNPQSPQAQALAWMSEEDAFSSRPQDIGDHLLLERYALVVLYYSTSGPDWLVDFPFLEGSTSVCEWNSGSIFKGGIFCLQGETVTTISLSKLQLRGSIPWELTLLDLVSTLYLDGNLLSGTLPSQLTGRAEWGSALLPSALEEVNLGDNLFSGTLPSDWSNTMNKLNHLRLANNRLEGLIPSEWGSFGKLTFLGIERNNLAGSLPTTFGALTSIQRLSLSENDLTGTLPTELSLLSDLYYFDISGNMGLFGTLPLEFGDLNALEVFSLNSTSLSGSLDSVFCSTGGSIPLLWANCLGEDADIQCSCCTYCCAPRGSFYCESIYGTAITGSQTRRSTLLSLLGHQIAPSDIENAWDLFDDPDTPQAKSIQWIVEEDEYSFDLSQITTQTLLERYVVAVLYFACSGSDWTRDFPFLDGTMSVCDWHSGDKGVKCASSFNSGSPVSILLHQMNLQGTLPWEISHLTGIVNLHLGENSINGSLPPQFKALTGLQSLRIPSNSLSGTLPSEWSNLLSLEHINLSVNSIGGTIPAEWGDLRQLTTFRLATNKLIGTIPSFIGSMTLARLIHLHSNRLWGTLPPELSILSRLQDLFLYSNNFTGTVPDSYRDLSSLGAIDLKNTSLTGSVDSIICSAERPRPGHSHADCLGVYPELVCSCCSLCCETDGGGCVNMTYR